MRRKHRIAMPDNRYRPFCAEKNDRNRGRVTSPTRSDQCIERAVRRLLWLRLARLFNYRLSNHIAIKLESAFVGFVMR